LVVLAAVVFFDFGHLHQYLQFQLLLFKLKLQLVGFVNAPFDAEVFKL